MGMPGEDSAKRLDILTQLIEQALAQGAKLRVHIHGSGSITHFDASPAVVLVVAQHRSRRRRNRRRRSIVACNTAATITTLIDCSWLGVTGAADICCDITIF